MTMAREDVVTVLRAAASSKAHGAIAVTEHTANNVASKRAAENPVPLEPPKKQRKSYEQFTPDDSLPLEGMPMARSGVSGLLDDMQLKPAADLLALEAVACA